VNGGELGILNTNVNLDFKTSLYNVPYIDPDTDPVLTNNINSLFYDADSFINKFSNVKSPVIISINVQSLNAKHDNLKQLLVRMSKKNVQVDVVVLQETWNVKHCNLLTIPGFNLCYKNRNIGRGGGVGFYIRTDLDYEIVEPPFNYFTDKIFESLTIRVNDSSCSKNNHYLISSVYRSPSPIDNVTQNMQMENFIENLESLLNFGNSQKCPAYICLDANINLLDLNKLYAINYYNCLMNCGYIPVNTKATRMQGDTISYIDHILSNKPSLCSNSGSIVDDLSDHWPTFMQLNSKKIKNKPSVGKRRLVNTVNMTNFRNTLSNLAWNDVLLTNDVDSCYDLFWRQFKNFYDLHFPMVTFRANRNFHKISDFMTQGLIVSRRTKITLLKQQLNNPTVANIEKYKKYRNLYNKLIRIRKKDHFNERLSKNQKNPKKNMGNLE
jgi:hypothetical protein